MAKPTCPSCQGSTFWATAYPVLGASGETRLVICRNCGTVVGALPSEDLAKQVQALTFQVNTLLNQLKRP